MTVLTTTKKRQTNFPLNWDTSDIEVIEVSYIDPISSFGVDKKIDTEKKQGSSNFILSIKKWLIDLYRHRLNERMPGRTDPWIFSAVKMLKQLQNKNRKFDVIISSYGPPSAHIVGYFAKKIFNAYWVADYRDLWIENQIYHGIWPFTKLEKAIEKKIISCCEMLIAVSEPHKKILEQKFSPIPVHVIENGYDAEALSQINGRYFTKPGPFRIVYTGSLYWHAQNPTPLFQAIKDLHENKRIDIGELEVLFYGSYTGPFLKKIQEFQLDQFVKYQGIVSQKEANSIQKSADCFLFIGSPKEDGILTGKLFEYLYFDWPILAIGIKKQSSPGRLIEKAQAGIVCGTDVEKIKNALITLIKGQYQKKKDASIIKCYSREHQVDKLISLIK